MKRLDCAPGVDEVLEATLCWGANPLQRVSVATWAPVRVGDLFALPDELGARTIDFGAHPTLGERKMVTWGSLGVAVEVAHAAPPLARGAREHDLVWVLVVAALHALAFGFAQSLPDDGGESSAERIAELRVRLSTTSSPLPSEERSATEGDSTRGGAAFTSFGSGLEGPDHMLSEMGDGPGGSGLEVDSTWNCMGTALVRMRTRTPALRCPEGQTCVTTGGRVSPEVIQRIVRANQGRFRVCYDRVHVSNPTLAGTVDVSFLIGRGGEVLAATESASDEAIPDADVRACIVRTFQSLTFPEPAPAPEAVVYRLQLSPE